ncbi:hypothetical protein, partial [Klebsiella pneumoniae]|uniref:hypothetical protein n=1 Tax=Klebsiella pneumoniae TaxID=573 RepID=UPI001968DBD3
FTYDEVKNADFIDFLAYLMKELRQDYQRDKKGLNSFFSYMEKYFKNYSNKKMNLFLKVIK